MRQAKTVYYNEFDPTAAGWLRELISSGLIPHGEVDERSIKEVVAADLVGYHSCHFFAGIGGRPLALRLAGWDDARPVWSGSCPCQPFSAAGKQQAQKDDRHLWPDFFRLIRECRPDVVFGEQVEGAVRHGWLDGVCGDLEGEGYAVGSAVLGAHSVGAPHIRQRLYWVADACEYRRDDEQGRPGIETFPRVGRDQPVDGVRPCRVADPDGRVAGHRGLQPGGEHGQQPEDGGSGVGLEHTTGDGRKQGRTESVGRCVAGGCSDGFWDAFDLIPCRDGKARRVEPGTFPLAHGLPGRVGLLRGYGNAIVPGVAAAFIEAYLESR